jgi:beta-N-acetylhexosaminidase
MDRNTGSASRWADSVIAALTPRDRAAQLVWPQVFGDFTPAASASWERVSKLVSAEHVGGFVMSIGSPIETAVKLNEMQRLSAVPLIVGADYESGAGFRTSGGYFLPNGIFLGGGTYFPRQMALGASRDTMLAYEQGRITALEGRAVGVHMAFTPVLDVNNNPNNPVIGPRSFGEDPALVGALGAAMVRGLQDNGMLATARFRGAATLPARDRRGRNRDHDLSRGGASARYQSVARDAVAGGDAGAAAARAWLQRPAHH